MTTVRIHNYHGEPVDETAKDSENYNECEHYKGVYTCGDYVMVDGVAYRTHRNLVEALVCGNATSPVHLTSDYSENYTKSYNLNLDTSRIVSNTSYDYPSWSRHHEEDFDFDYRFEYE